MKIKKTFTIDIFDMEICVENDTYRLMVEEETIEEGDSDDLKIELEKIKNEIDQLLTAIRQ